MNRSSTPGTRMRRELVKGLRVTQRQMRWLIGTWTPYSTVMLTGAELNASREAGGGWNRDRREDEYPENAARDLKNTYVTIGALIGNLQVLQGQVAARYREVLADQEAGHPDAGQAST